MKEEYYKVDLQDKGFNGGVLFWRPQSLGYKVLIYDEAGDFSKRGALTKKELDKLKQINLVPFYDLNSLKRKNKKSFPKCCGQPMKVKQSDGDKDPKVYCELCGETLR